MGRTEQRTGLAQNIFNGLSTRVDLSHGSSGRQLDQFAMMVRVTANDMAVAPQSPKNLRVAARLFTDAKKSRLGIGRRQPFSDPQ